MSWGGSWGAAAVASLFITACGTAFTTVEELNVFSDHAKFASFLAGRFVIPRIELESSFNKNRTPLVKILPGKFRK